MIYTYGQLGTYSSHAHAHPHTHTVHTVRLHSTYQMVDACCPPGLRKRVRRSVKYDELIHNIVYCNVHDPIPADALHPLIKHNFRENNSMFMDNMRLDGLKITE